MSTILHAVHDVFTILCDYSLNRRNTPWRWADPDPYRLRFLRHMSKESGLLDSLTAQPTILAEDWLCQPPGEQLALLANTWIAQSDTHARQRCFDQILSQPSGMVLDWVELTRRSSADRQSRLWQPLVWLGYLIIDDRESKFPMLSVASTTQPTTDSPAWAFAGLTVLVEPPYNWVDLWALEHIAVLQELGPPRRYLLTGGQGATQQRADYHPKASVDLLERASGEALPKMILDIFKPYADILIEQGAVLTFSDAEQLTALRQSHTWRQRLSHVLSPVHVWVPAAAVPGIVRAVQRQGLAVRIEPFPATAASSRPTWQDNDHLRLLLAARVLAELADELDLTAPLDAWTLARLTTHLPVDRQRRLERLVDDQVREIRRRLPEPGTSANRQPAEYILAAVTQTIKAGAVIQLFYQPPAPRPLITRPVIPLRLETWGARTYLLATCLHRRAPRSFRLDRIVAVEAENDRDSELPGLSS